MIKSGQSIYISPSVKTAGHKRVTLKTSIASFFAAFFLLTAFLGAAGIAGTPNSTKHGNTAQAASGFDPVRWVMCYFGKDSIPERAYQYANTDRLNFSLFSKSSITGGIDDVTSGLNWMLDLNSPDFKTKNEAVLGRTLYELLGNDLSKTGNTDTPATPKETPKFNSGPQLNPVDRFGVAGLQFTSYQGEWKYVVVDACNPDSEPKDPKTGLYYDDRMVPQTTWEGLPTTMDIRSMQANKGFLTIEVTAYMNTMSNIIFAIPKTIVTLTVALISFSLTDIVKTMGIESVLIGENGDGGIFTKLFNGLYIPLVVIAFTATAFYMLFMAIFRREFRKSLTALIRSIAMFFLAFIIAANPGFWMALPNNVAVMLEAVTISALDGSTVGKNSLCTTQTGKYQKGKDLDEGAGKSSLDDIKGAANGKYLETVSKNMQSVVSCTLWQEFLFKPWAQGQFGVDWNETWAKGKIPSWAPKGAKAFEPKGPHVLEIAGDAAVPMGNGKFINNWALFQLSTQTNVHSPLKKDGEVSKITAGVNNDWWRVVDVVSGYDEKTVKTTIPSSQAGGDDTTSEHQVPDESASPLPSWGTWVGSASASRVMVALSAAFVAFVGVIGPLVFALMSAVYSVGIAILMLFSPIMLLFGVWADRGYELFKAWLDMVINLVIKRVMYGMLMVLSILFSSTAISIMQNDGWWKGVITLIVLTAILVKNRKRIVDSIASVQLSRLSLEERKGAVINKIGGSGKVSGTILTNAIAGGVSSKMHGGTIRTGVSAGVRNEMRNLARNNEFAASAMRVYASQDVAKKGKSSTELGNMKFCQVCKQQLTGNSEVGALRGGGYICGNCLDDGVLSNEAVPMTVDFTQARKDQAEDDKAKKGGKARQHSNPQNRTTQSFMDTQAARNIIKTTQESEKLSYSEKIDNVAHVASNVEKDIEKIQKEDAGLASATYEFDVPTIPEAIKDFVNIQVLEEAWHKRDFDYIRQAYSYAWAMWCQQEFGGEWKEALRRIHEEMVNKQAP